MSNRRNRKNNPSTPRNRKAARDPVAALFNDDTADAKARVTDLLGLTDQSDPAKMSFQKRREDIKRVPPHHYLHVLNQNTNVTRVIEGPTTFICQDHEVVVADVTKMITVPPRSYIIIDNPAIRDQESGRAELDEHGQAIIRHGESEVRLQQDPFPLYPGENAGKIQKLQTVYQNKALRLQALQDLVDSDGVEHKAGTEWQFEGPGTYIPNVMVRVLDRQKARVVKENTALKLRALQNCEDRNGNKRVAGEEWLVNKVGAYLPGPYEQIVELVSAEVLTDKRGLHVRANKTFTDQFGIERKSGEEWLLTNDVTETYIPSVYEVVTSKVRITTLTSRQYCVICDPFDKVNGVNLFGEKRLVRGECSFFLSPHETLQNGIERVKILQEEDGLILACLKAFEDDSGNEVIMRQPGERWVIRGPMEYVPPVEIRLEREIKAIPLDKNEGIYVQNNKTGKIRAVIGQTYMLTEDEDLYEKELETNLEYLLFSGQGYGKVPANVLNAKREVVIRDKTKVIKYRVPHNTACQIYNYGTNSGRVVFGPALVLLDPEEEFTPISLSGGVPKTKNQIQTLSLLLGPDYILDEIEVETSDHARLQLNLSYNWYFQVDKENPARLFTVADFVGDSCKAVASRIRGAVAGVTFDDFHKHSAKLIRAAVFGKKSQVEEFLFPANGLVITGIDIKSVDPLDPRTKEALQKSVQIAIEITTNTQQAKAQQEAQMVKQSAMGKLDRQKIHDACEVEISNKDLYQIMAETRAVESTGQKMAEARSAAEGNIIRWKAELDLASLEVEAMKIEKQSEIDEIDSGRTLELDLMETNLAIEADMTEQMANIETHKFEEMVQVIGADTIRAMALAGPEMQAKLLGGLGIESTLIMDGNSPINLFNTASGLVANNSGARSF